MQATPGPDQVEQVFGSYEALLWQLTWFVVGFLVVYAIGRVVVEPAVLRVVRTRNRENPTLVQAVERYVRALVILVALVTGVTTAGYGRVLTSSAIIVAAATLAIGVAGQAVIGNLISGVFLVADRNFNVGDWIAWNDREGTVEAISFRTTRVRTVNNEVISVPNTELTTSAILRPYGRERYRVGFDLGVSYDDDVDLALDLLVEVAHEVPNVLEDPEPRAFVVGFGPDAVQLRAFYWVSTPTRRNIAEVRSTYSRRVKRRFDEAGLTIAPPSKRDLLGSVTVEREEA